MNLTDGLNNMNQQELATAAFLVIDRIQNEPPAMQVQAMSVLFLLLTDVLGLDPRVELERAGRYMKGADKRYNYTFNAIRAYIDGELKLKTL